MYSFLFIIPSWAMEVNVVQRRKKNQEFDSTPSILFLKQHKENESLFFGPAFIPPQFHADWVLLNLIWDLNVIWISSLVGHHSDKPLIWGTGARHHDGIMLKMRNLTRLDRSLCKWSEGTLYGSP